jgi:glycosyltransferase involved in cell wall biosynthesis
MKRIVVVPSDTTACGLYRMKYPAGAVQQVAPDWKIEVYRPTEVKFATGADGSLWGVQGIPSPETIDLLVMQRVATRAQSEFVTWMRKQGAAVVVDVDDDLRHIHPENAAWSHWNEGPSHWRWLEAATAEADLVTVTTQRLAQRYASHGRVEVLPNCIPGDVREMLRSVRDQVDQTPTLGWAGFTATHPHDLTEVGDAVHRVVSETGALVRAIGDGPGCEEAWKVPVDHVNAVEIGMPYYTALTLLDIGLVPLMNHQFNRSKSYLKALEYAACGLAVVASDTPAHRELSKTLPIFLANQPEEWYEAITYLVTHPDERSAGTLAIQDTDFAEYTFEANADKWAQSWARAMLRRGRML